MLWIIPVILIALSLLVIGFILWKKIPQLRVIDVDAIPTERVRRIKENLIMQRFERIGSQKFGRVTKAGGAAVKGASRIGRRAVQRLYKLEQYYQKMKQAPSESGRAMDMETAQRMMNEAQELIRKEEYIPAEKLYIEVISHHPKLVEAYEGLGNLYLKNRQFTQARETLSFTLRLAPDDASVHMSMAELEMKEENYKAALAHVRHSTNARPNNPKYLDTYIETSLLAKAFEDAEKGLIRIKEVNPENKKIPEWEERLAALKGDGKDKEKSSA